MTDKYMDKTNNPVDTTNIVIETQRLRLRAFLPSDESDLFDIASVEGVAEMLGQNHHKTIDDTRQLLNHYLEKKNMFAIEYKQDNRVVGSLGLNPSWADTKEEYNRLRFKEIIYMLSKDYWGLGIMPEAVKAVIAYFFDNNLIDGFTCGHFAINQNSRRVIEKCGFRYVGTSEYYSKYHDKTYENLNYILLRSKPINTLKG